MRQSEFLVNLVSFHMAQDSVYDGDRVETVD